MKRSLFILILLLAAPAFGQHSVTLNWIASPDSTTAAPGTITVYRASAACPASGIGALSYTKLTSTAPAGGPYTDLAVTAGTTYCYYIVAVIGSATAPPSNALGGTIPVGAATSLMLVVK
jgi:hypothetical protein